MSGTSMRSISTRAGCRTRIRCRTSRSRAWAATPAGRWRPRPTTRRRWSTTKAAKGLGAALGARAQLVHPGARGGLVGLGERRVVEAGAGRFFARAGAARRRLADVHHLGGTGAEDVHAEQLEA